MSCITWRKIDAETNINRNVGEIYSGGRLWVGGRTGASGTYTSACLAVVRHAASVPGTVRHAASVRSTVVQHAASVPAAHTARVGSYEAISTSTRDQRSTTSVPATHTKRKIKEKKRLTDLATRMRARESWRRSG
eukprot:1807871-Rhodomonas_salina.2